MAALPHTPVALKSLTSLPPPPRGAPSGLRSSFLGPSFRLRTSPSAVATTVPRFSMRVASKQAYICRDCGYIYNDRTPFEKLPDSFFCPDPTFCKRCHSRRKIPPGVCGAPKRRFRAYEPAVNKNANDQGVRKARKAQLKRDEAIGNALPIGIAVGAALLAAVFFYLNNVY